MPLQPPVLDDRTFEQIVGDAKTLIPRYAPEWTDHNESDPGITLVQLFAWMTEAVIYRLNQVPELNYVKFLQLLGVELKPAQPAAVDLSFTVDPALDAVEIGLGTQVAAAGGEEPIVFETDANLVALGAQLASVQAWDGFAFARVEAQNDAPRESYFPFGSRAREGGALYLGFATALAFTRQQVDLAVYVPDSGDGGASVSCDADVAGLPLPATVVWEFWHERGEWRAVDMIADETRAFTRSGHVRFRGPGADAARAQFGHSAPDLFWVRARLARSTYERAPRLDAVLTNTVGATQATTVRDEVVGGSDGTPRQRFRLRNAPVVAGSLRLEVDEGRGFEAWEEVDDLLSSGSDDPRFVLNRTTGEIRFGDGEHGRIPAANRDLPNASIVARRYRYGGGRVGNVGAGADWELERSLPGVLSTANRRAAGGGTEEESVEQAKERAPGQLKSKDRAVTVEDFELLAREAPGARVRRAKAAPLRHPRFPGASIPGVVTVVVVPDAETPAPAPNEATLAAVCAHLNRHRLLTSEVYVTGPRYRKARIEADVVVGSNADLAQVKQDVESRLRAFLHPLTGGDDGDGWEFGGDIYFSDVYRIVLGVDGVDRIDENRLYIWLGLNRYGPCEDVPIDDLDLVYSEEHEIRVAYRERR